MRLLQKSMSICKYGHSSDAHNRSEFLTTYPAKALTKVEVDLTSKLQVLQALDNGRCKDDVAREYGFHPKTIAEILKERNTILKKYRQKYNLIKQVCDLNLEQNLLNWFEQQISIGNTVTEDHLRIKALEILKPLSEEFTCIDDWLTSFRMRHHISKYTTEDVRHEKPKDEWRRFLRGYDSKDIYLGGVCALAYNLELSSYLNGQDTDNYVSVLFIVNALGTDKREVAVVGKDSLESEAGVKSLSVSYYSCVNSQLNYSIIHSHLMKWDSELSLKGEYVTLVLDIPDGIRYSHFEHIKIIRSSDLKYVRQIMSKIEECFKFNYRKLQICRSSTYGKDNTTYLDYIHMIGNAWHSLSSKYLITISLPAEEGSLYFNMRKDNENDFSISYWCKSYNIPLNTKYPTSMLDKYIYCDKDLPSIYNGPVDKSMMAVEVLSEREPHPSSGMEAYQAMKRLVSYLQSENAGENENGESLMKYAKYMENHLEYGALQQMHQIIASTNDSN